MQPRNVISSCLSGDVTSRGGMLSVDDSLSGVGSLSGGGSLFLVTEQLCYSTQLEKSSFLAEELMQFPVKGWHREVDGRSGLIPWNPSHIPEDMNANVARGAGKNLPATASVYSGLSLIHLFTEDIP